MLAKKIIELGIPLATGWSVNIAALHRLVWRNSRIWTFPSRYHIEKQNTTKRPKYDTMNREANCIFCHSIFIFPFGQSPHHSVSCDAVQWQFPEMSKYCPNKLRSLEFGITSEILTTKSYYRLPGAVVKVFLWVSLRSSLDRWESLDGRSVSPFEWARWTRCKKVSNGTKPTTGG